MSDDPFAALRGLTVARTVETFLPHVSGPAREAFELSSALERHGIPSPVWTSRLDVGAAPPDAEVLDGVRVGRLGAVVRAGRYALTLGLPARLKDVAVVDCHNLRNAQLDLAAWNRWRGGAPYVIRTHGGLRGFRSVRLGRAGSLAYRTYDRLILARVLAGASAVIVATAVERKEAVEAGIPSRKVLIIPPGVKTSRPVLDRRPDPDRLRLLCVGRLGPQRHPEVMVEALVHLPGASLDLVGPFVALSALEGAGSSEALRARADALGVGGRLRIHGRVSEEGLEEAYAGADLFLYVSDYEGAGFPMLEAAVRGLPLVVTPVGLAPDLVREGETGRFTRPDPSRLAEDIRATAAASPWAAAAAWASTLRARYGWEAAAARSCEAYRAAIEGRDPA